MVSRSEFARGRVKLRKPKNDAPVVDTSAEALLSDLKKNVAEIQKASPLVSTGGPLILPEVPDDGTPLRKNNFHDLYTRLVLFLSGKYQPEVNDPIYKKLQNASLRDVVYCLAEVADQLRLEEGKATEIKNVTHRVAIVLDYGQHKGSAIIDGETGESKPAELGINR